MNLPRTTDQARKELHEMANTASPIQLLMFLVIIQAVQIVQYLQKVQHRLPAPRKRLGKSVLTQEMLQELQPDKQEWRLGDPAAFLADGTRVTDEQQDNIQHIFRNAMASYSWPDGPMRPPKVTVAISDGRLSPPANLSYRDVDAENPNATFYDPALLGQDVEQGDGPSLADEPRLQQGGYIRDHQFRSTIHGTWLEESSEFTEEDFNKVRNRMDDARRAYNESVEDAMSYQRGPWRPYKTRWDEGKGGTNGLRQRMFNEFFPDVLFTPERYQDGMDWYDDCIGVQHPFSDNRLKGLEFRHEARRFEMVYGSGEYRIAGLPSDQYREMNSRPAMGYCTPSREMFTNGPAGGYGWDR